MQTINTSTCSVHEGQTLIDIAMQYCGDALAVFDIADLNALGVTDELIPGQTIFIPDVAIDKTKVVEAFAGLTPASSYNDEDIELTWESAGPLVITKEGSLSFDKLRMTVGEGQTIIDIAMQLLGDVSRAFEIADLNGLSITDDLMPGQTLIIPEVAIDKIKIVAAFSGLQPASMDDENVLDEVFDGIDYWAIEEDFIVQEG